MTDLMGPVCAVLTCVRRLETSSRGEPLPTPFTSVPTCEHPCTI